MAMLESAVVFSAVFIVFVVFIVPTEVLLLLCRSSDAHRCVGTHHQLRTIDV
jgi:hypothetical protein